MLKKVFELHGYVMDEEDNWNADTFDPLKAIVHLQQHHSPVARAVASPKGRIGVADLTLTGAASIGIGTVLL